MNEPSDPSRGVTEEHRSRFFAHLDTLPFEDRPVYGFAARKASAWQWVGGGPTYVLVLVFPHHVVFSTRRGSAGPEKSRRAPALAEIASIGVVRGPLRAKAVIRFVDGEELRLSGIDRAAAGVLARFDDRGVAAFDRDTWGQDAFPPFFVACSRVLPLPDGLFADKD